MSPPRTTSAPRHLTFLSHALDRSGPPIYLLHLLRWMRDHTDIAPRVVALVDGDLHDEFAELAETTVLGEPLPVRIARGSAPLTRARDRWRGRALRAIPDDEPVYVNTSWSVRGLRYLPQRRGPVVAHVHELQVGLDYHLQAADRRRLLRSDRWIAASAAVADNLATSWDVPRSEIHVHHEMIDTGAPATVSDGEVAALRASLGIGPDAVLVGTAAVVNWRKAPDLFVELGARLVRDHPDLDVHLAWVGVDERSAETAAIRADARRAGIADRLHLVPVSPRPEAWMRAIDLFALTAREDAFPLACLEAAAAARPIVCFDAGGMPEFVEPGAGVVVDFPDVAAMAAAIDLLGSDGQRRHAMGEVARQRVVERHDASVAAPKLWTDVAPWLGMER